MVGAVRAAGGRGLHAPRAGQCRGVRAPGDRGADRRASMSIRWTRTSTGGRARSGCRITVDRVARTARIDFTGTTARARDQLQRAGAGDAGGGALRLPLPRRRRHPDERGGDEAAARWCCRAGTMLSPRLSGGGDRGQRRDQPGGDLGAVPGARGAGGGAVDDEQHHLGRRPAASTTRRSAAAPAPGGSSDGRGYDGTGGVHSHMTNSRLTDPEVLEWRFPVVLDEFRLRDGLGRRRALPRRRRGERGASASSRR